MMRVLLAWMRGRIITTGWFHHHHYQNQRKKKRRPSLFCPNISIPTEVEVEVEVEVEAERGKEEEAARYVMSKIHGSVTCRTHQHQLKKLAFIHHRLFCSNIFLRTEEGSAAKGEVEVENAATKADKKEEEEEEENEVNLQRDLLQGESSLNSSTSAGTEENTEEGTDVMSKRDLLLQEGLNESQINTVLSAEPRSDKLALLLHLLRNRGITGTLAGSFLCSNPSFINSNLNSFRMKLELLEESGLTGELLRRFILLRSGSLSLSSSPQNLQKHVSFLKEIGLDPSGICLTMARLPEFFKLSIEKNVMPRCDLLYSKGMSKESLAHILRSHPRVFSGSLEPGLSKRLELLEYFGLDLKTKGGVRALGLWSKYAPQRLMVKFEYMKTLGFSHDQAILMVRRQPNVLCMREDAMKRKISYLSETLGRDIEELLSCPGYMTSSLEKRLIPRFALINQLKEKGLLVKHVPLCSVVTTSDEAFAKRFRK